MKLVMSLLFLFTFSVHAELTLKKVESDIFGEYKLDKEEVLPFLLSDSHQDKNLANYLRSLVYGFGLYGAEKSIVKSEMYFLPLLSLEYRNIFFFAGPFGQTQVTPRK
ncbi:MULTISPECIES: hypothetical protein [unclassified Pseudoalteromonas]|uniref:hypothetical protein n=1 Tax=unclassified Pseudoalteromonas TaxID=194690 RepID=UPI002097627E|nr:hypothetical protein [Pseudoalteromonas sp. XMcav2-N]MCO7187421.1 hypothetical protein [Pseudoalteromonas sp. XMcav2-N]